MLHEKDPDDHCTEGCGSLPGGSHREGLETRSGKRQRWTRLVLWLVFGFAVLLWPCLLSPLADMLFHAWTDGKDETVSAESDPDIPEEDGTPAFDRILHVLLIGLTDEPRIGKARQVNLDTMKKILEQEVPKERLDVVTVKGGDCNPGTVLSEVRSLGQRAKRGDTLFCYYSGHGAYDPRYAVGDPSGGHFLQLEASPGRHLFQPAKRDLPRKTLFSTLLAQPGRLKVLVTDTCNVAGRTGYALAAEVDSIQSGPTPLEQLLLHHRGYVDLISTSRDQSAWGDTEIGTLFTLTFRQVATATWFEVTDSSADALRAAGLPGELLRKLEALRGRQFHSHLEFRDELTKVLTEDELMRFGEIICTHAVAGPDDWPRFVKKLSHEADAFFRGWREMKLKLLLPEEEREREMLRRQSAMNPKVFQMRVVKDKEVPGVPARIIRRTHLEVIFTGK